ncbi:MAG: hypothetical protein HFJ28_04770 [Clostridia bacterium]|jgi:hypothetical protein|nr:hypothetical protein [Clostridia bacterium]
MEYLKKYGLTSEEIQKIKQKYSKEIIKFIVKNEIFVTDTIEYLYSKNIKCIYLLMINNIKLFLETKIALQEKIRQMEIKGYKTKTIQMALLQKI